MSLVGACSTPRARLMRSEISLAMDFDLARDLAAVLDLDLAVGDLARNVAGGADQQALADDEIALETAAHFGIVDRRDTFEEAALGDIDVVAIMQVGLDISFDQEPGAGGDLARQRNAVSHDQMAGLGGITTQGRRRV